MITLKSIPTGDSSELRLKLEIRKIVDMVGGSIFVVSLIGIIESPSDFASKLLGAFVGALAGYYVAWDRQRRG